MSSSPEITLTRLDKRVLVECERPVRARDVVARLARHWDRDVVATWDLRRGRYDWQPSAAFVDEVRGILRGLEHLGLVEQRGGWWRKAG